MVYVLRFALIVVYTVFWGVPAMLAAPFSGEAIVWIGRMWQSWIFRACGIRVEAEGLEHIDRTRSYVFMTNHQSVLDSASSPGSRFSAGRSGSPIRS